MNGRTRTHSGVRVLLSVLAILFIFSTQAACCFTGLCNQAATQIPVPLCREVPPTKLKPRDAGITDGRSPEDISAYIRNTTRSVVSIEVKKKEGDGKFTYSSGTGFIIDDKLTVLTAEHVIRGAHSVTITFQKARNDCRGFDYGNVIPVEVFRSNSTSEVDGAYLRPTMSLEAKDRVPPPLELNTEWVPKKGGLVWQFGRTTRWTKGRIIRPVEGDHNELFSVAMTVQYGDSGGPVLTTDGKVVGMAVQLNIETREGVTLDDPKGRLTEQDPTNDIGYIVPISRVMKILGPP